MSIRTRRDRQFEVAAALIEQNEAEISNWGSYYGVQTIEKRQAVTWLREAFNKVRAKYAGKS